MKSALSKGGFTLIELMAAMVILIVVVMLMTVIFNDANRIWSLGTGRAVNCISGRAALNLIEHDLEHAVADEVLSFAAKPDKYGITMYGLPCDEICFVSLQNDSGDGNRTAREIFYYVSTNSAAKPANLMRGYYSSEISDAVGLGYLNHCYWKMNWYDGARPGNARPIIEHVTALSFFVPTNQNGYCGLSYHSTNSYPYALVGGVTNYLYNSLPEYVDVYLEVLDELDADKLVGIAATNRAGFVERNVRRYSTRVYFQNRLGYKKR